MALLTLEGIDKRLKGLKSPKELTVKFVESILTGEEKEKKYTKPVSKTVDEERLELPVGVFKNKEDFLVYLSESISIRDSQQIFSSDSMRIEVVGSHYGSYDINLVWVKGAETAIKPGQYFLRKWRPLVDKYFKQEADIDRAKKILAKYDIIT